MADLPVHDKVFPFVCKNPECGESFEIETFIEAALLWGFLYFENKEHKLIGLTCPFIGCQKTTLRKFPFFTKDFSIDILNEVAAKQYISTYSEEDIQFTQYVPFSFDFSHWHSIRPGHRIYHRPPQEGEVIIPPFPGPEDFGHKFVAEEKFSIPNIISPLNHPYPSLLTRAFPYSFTENHLIYCCHLEKDYGFKVIPRIVPNHNIYKFSDALFRAAPENNLSVDSIRELLIKVFEELVNFHNLSSWSYFMSSAPELPEVRDNYRKMLEKFNKKNFKHLFAKFYNSYAKARNMITFELDYPAEFIRDFIVEFSEPIYENPQYAFFQEGDSWTIIFNNKIIGRRFRGNGFKYIYYLISHPYREFKTIELELGEPPNDESKTHFEDESQEEREEKDPKKKGAIDFEDKTDDKSLLNYKKRLKNLIHDRRRAEEEDDVLHIRDIDEEYKKIESEIKKLVGAFGKKKKFPSNQSKIKNRVTKSIERVLKNIEKENVTAYEHLNNALKPINSYTLSYRPTQAIDWQLTPN